MEIQNAVHPGEILKYEFLAPLGMSAGRLAAALNLPRTRIERIIKEETAVTIDTAVRLARYFGTTPLFWVNLQTQFDLVKATAEVDVSDIAPLAYA